MPADEPGSPATSGSSAMPPAAQESATAKEAF